MAVDLHAGRPGRAGTEAAEIDVWGRGWGRGGLDPEPAWMEAVGAGTGTAGGAGGDPTGGEVGCERDETREVGERVEKTEVGWGITVVVLR